jgi:histidine ammonia-lyase
MKIQRSGAGTVSTAETTDSAPGSAASADAPKPQLALTGHLTFRDAAQFIEQTPKVVLHPDAREHMVDNRDKAVWAARESAEPIYAWTTDVGMHCTEPVSATDVDAQRDQQISLLRRSDAGRGERLSTATVRLALLFRANAMARAEMGVRPEVAERLLALLNAGVTPVVLDQGSLGNGDLTQMARVGRAAIADRVRVRYRGTEGLASEILPKLGFDPFELEMGEAIAIMSGSTVVAAALAVALKKAEDVSALTDAALALSLEASRAHVDHLDWFADPTSKAQVTVANQLGTLLQGTQWGTSEARGVLGETERVQEVFSVRTSLPTHALVHDEIARAVRALEQELQSTPSNPKVLPKDDGNVYFQESGSSSGAGLGHAAVCLNIATLPLADHSVARAKQLVNDPRLGLKDSVVGQAVVDAVPSEMWQRAAPPKVSEVAKSDQEDLSSGAMRSVQNLDSNLDELLDVLCIELLVAYRGIEKAAPKLDGMAMGAGTQELYDYLGKLLSTVQSDSPGEDLEVLRNSVRSGQLLDALNRIQGGLSVADVARRRDPLPAASWEAVDPAPAPTVERPALVLPTSRGEWEETFGKRWNLKEAPEEMVSWGRDLHWPASKDTHATVNAFLAGQGRSDYAVLPKGLRSYRDRHNDWVLPTRPQLIPFGDRFAVNVPDAPGGPKLVMRDSGDSPSGYNAGWSEPLPGVKWRSVAFCAVPNRGIYAFGGCEVLPDWRQQTFAARLDEERREWKLLPPLPRARAAASAFQIKDHIYVIGGPPEPNRVDRFNLETQRWEEPIYLENDWSSEVSAWVEDDRLVIASGKDPFGNWNSSAEIIDAVDPAAPVLREVPGGLGFGTEVKSLRIVDTSQGKIAVGADENGQPFSLRWRPPKLKEG